MKNKILKIVFIVISILLITPSVIYLVQNKTVRVFNTYFNFFINEGFNKNISTILYLVLFISLMVIYLIMIKQKNLFKDIKQILKFVAIVGILFIMMLPWTSADIFYYMGVGELDSQYNQNPYYTPMELYCSVYKDEVNNDEILIKGMTSGWGEATVIYGPMAQLIFKVCTAISFKNINLCILIFKLINVIVHLGNCYLIYKLSNKKLALIYGLNPFIFLEYIANVHNDIIVVFFILLSLYFLLKRKDILISILFLALATGIKYFAVLLFPVVIIYHFREEKNVGKRFLRCFQYGLLFLTLVFIQYLPYLRDFRIFGAILVQNSKYTKSIYYLLLTQNDKIMFIVKHILTISFIIYYLKFCIDLIKQKEIKIYKTIRKYDLALILFLLVLTSFHQWYLIWLFPTMIWQKAKKIRNIIGLTAATQIANSAFMFQLPYIYIDNFFIVGTIVLFVIWQICVQKFAKKRTIHNLTGGENG